MFEDMTYDYLMQQYLEAAPENVDTRQGSIYYDAGAGIILEIAKLYTDLDLVLSMTQLDTTSGDYLDAKASEYGVSRQAATYAEYWVTIEGTVPDIGSRFYYDGMYFTFQIDSATGLYFLQAEESGTAANGIYEGTPAVPVNTITGLISATFGMVKSYGTDAEDDDSLRERVEEKIAGTAENGNKQHYKTWCESVDGVGLARISPLWNGPNTVRGQLINSLGLPCSDSVVAEVQNYVDPATHGYTTEVNGKTYVVGDGLGEGVANIGAHFTACAPDILSIDVEFSASAASGRTLSDIEEEASEAISNYLQQLTLSTDESENIVVRYTAIGATLSALSSIVDYSDLTINGGTANITPGEDSIPVIGEVVVNVLS